MSRYLRITSFALVALACLSHPARADMLQDCAEAVQANDVTSVQKIGIALMGVEPFPVERLEEARSCLSFIGQGDVRYDQETRRITFSDRAVAEFALERQRRDDQIAMMETTETERRDQAIARTIQACRELYSRDWVIAMTSQICQPIFMKIGLPD